jgi:hypothetical protein
MSTLNLAQRRRLILQLERDLVAQARLRTLLTDADATVASRRHDLQSVTARINRAHTRSASHTRKWAE